jgi:hypothetical protein
MNVQISIGELWDKYSILMLKTEKIKEEAKLNHVRNELSHLPTIDLQHPLFVELKQVNETLWNIEDLLRVKETRQEFDAEFIMLARSVYITNDRRAEIKRDINSTTNSVLCEVKSYVGI